MLEGVGSFGLHCLGFAKLGLEQLGEAAKQDFLTSPWAVRPAGTNIALNIHSNPRLQKFKPSGTISEVQCGHTSPDANGCFSLVKF